MSDDPLSRLEKAALAFLALVVAGFGGVVVVRSAFQDHRKTDFGVYARAGHAVRTGQDVYGKAVCDDRGWHYCYPPTLAVLMVPLADPFVWEDRAGYLPFGVSVAIWYVLSVGFLAAAVHGMASAALPDAVPWSRRWWYARLVPVGVCLGGIGATLSRGQVNLLQVALTAGMFAAAVRGRPVVAGVWLAGAVALKVIPAFLVLFAVGRFVAAAARGEWRAGELLRTAAGTAVGLAVLLGAVPASVWGIDGAVRGNRQVLGLVLAPAATGGGDQTRSKELTGATATDSQTFQSAVHNLRHPDRSARPADVDRTTRLLHWICGGTMTLVTLLAAVRLRPDPADQLVYLGCLSAVMLLVTPVSHVHYYAMALPLVMGLWLKGSTTPLAAWGVLTAAVLLPDPVSVAMRDYGAGVVATAALWAVGLRAVVRRPEPPEIGLRGGRTNVGQSIDLVGRNSFRVSWFRPARWVGGVTQKLATLATLPSGPEPS